MRHRRAGVIGAVLALGNWAVEARRPEHRQAAYGRLRRKLARVILLGLEILLLADIILTIVVEPTLDSVAILAVIVAIRIVLSSRWRSRSTEPGRGTAGAPSSTRSRASGSDSTKTRPAPWPVLASRIMMATARTPGQRSRHPQKPGDPLLLTAHDEPASKSVENRRIDTTSYSRTGRAITQPAPLPPQPLQAWDGKRNRRCSYFNCAR